MTFDILLIIILAVVLLFWAYYGLNYFLKHKVLKTPDIISGKRISGTGTATKLGYPTVNIDLESKIRCGFYRGMYDGKEVVILVGKHDPYLAEVHFLEYDNKIDNVDHFIFTSIKRIINEKSDVITTYNNGCDC